MAAHDRAAVSETSMPVLADLERKDSAAPVSTQVELQPWLGLISVAALFCSTVEVTFLESVDVQSLFMTPWELALEVGVALIVLLAVSAVWWMFTMLVSGALRFLPVARRYASWLSWFLLLSFPFSYFTLELLTAVRLRFFPAWHPVRLVLLTTSLSLVAICATGLFYFGLSKVQRFCRTRLAPIGWVHLAFGIVMAVVLGAHGVHPFPDRVGPSRAFAGLRPPDVYLITIDALRAEDMSVYGYERFTTPNLQRLAARSFVFDNFVANSNLTAPTTTSIETGKLPWTHHVFHNGGFVRDAARQETLAALLRRRGYYTAMISSNPYASPLSHATDRSYDAVELAPSVGTGGVWMSNPAGIDGQNTIFSSLLRGLGSLAGFLHTLIWNRYPYPAEQVFERAQSLLASNGKAQPMFIWTHIFPPHDPYWPEAPYRLRFAQREGLPHIHAGQLPPGWTAAELRAQYDEMILYADHTVGDYLDWLDRTGRLDHAIVIVTADHGESFERNWFLHGGPYLHSGLVHIPLLIHLPGQQRGVSVSQLAQQADLLPTILELVGAPVPSWTEGISLRPVLEGQALPPRFVFSMVLESDSVFRPVSTGVLTIMDDDFKYQIRLGSQEQKLYRYKIDRSETHDLTASEPEVAKRMHDLLLAEIGEANDRFASRR
jgi:arylsulfatase A-like enzyme